MDGVSFLSCLNTRPTTISSNHNLIKVDPKHTSQTCSRCGYVDKNNRVTQSRFVYISCDFTINADVNAAKNILERGIHGNNARQQPKVA